MIKNESTQALIASFIALPLIRVIKDKERPPPKSLNHAHESSGNFPVKTVLEKE
jgi:hypothetical protein